MNVPFLVLFLGEVPANVSQAIHSAEKQNLRDAI